MRCSAHIMPSADFCAAFGGFPPSRQSGHKGHGRQRRRSPEVSLTAFRTPPPEFTPSALDGYGLRDPTPARPAPFASNPLLVHWLVRLLHASFRPTLALGPLRLATLHLHQVGRGLSPPCCQTCSAHVATGFSLCSRGRGRGHRLKLGH
jgi:hypothetical protein